MKKKIIISVTAVVLIVAIIGASVGVYMSYINKYEPIASPTSLSYTKSDSQKNLLKMQELAKPYASIIEQLDSIVRIDITATL